VNSTLKSKLTQFWRCLQDELFEFLSDLKIDLTPRLQELVRVLEMVEIERFVPPGMDIGRPAKNQVELARAFMAKTVLNLPTTEALIERLTVDLSLRRLCGFSTTHKIPGKHRFSRAFAEFAAFGLAEKCHAALVQKHLGDQIIGHVARDSTAIEAREKAHFSAPKTTVQVAKKPKRGRPRKGEICPHKPPTQLELQRTQNLSQMIAELPTLCDVGTKIDNLLV
jgi:hypothetical protein